MRIDVEKTLITRETTIFILIVEILILISVVKNQSLSFELKVDTPTHLQMADPLTKAKVDTTELRKTLRTGFLKKPEEKRGSRSTTQEELHYKNRKSSRTKSI